MKIESVIFHGHFGYRLLVFHEENQAPFVRIIILDINISMCFFLDIFVLSIDCNYLNKRLL